MARKLLSPWTLLYIIEAIAFVMIWRYTHTPDPSPPPKVNRQPIQAELVPAVLPPESEYEIIIQEI